MQGGIYLLLGSTVNETVAILSSERSDDVTTRLWHMWLSHMSEKGMIILVGKGLLKSLKSCKLGFYENCVFEMHKRVKFDTAKHISKGILEYINSDVWGSTPINSLGGARYFLTLIDDYSRKVWVYFPKQKGEVFDKFKQWKAMVKKQTELSVKRLRTNNGGEFCNKEFMEFCRNTGIVRHHVVPRTPQQNEVAKWMNRTLLEHAQCMRINVAVPKSFWVEAINTTTYVVNKSPSTAIDLKIP